MSTACMTKIRRLYGKNKRGLYGNPRYLMKQIQGEICVHAFELILAISIFRFTVFKYSVLLTFKIKSSTITVRKKSHIGVEVATESV